MQLQLVELNFAGLLDADRELLRAPKLIDGDRLHAGLRPYYSMADRHGKPVRPMVGLQLLEDQQPKKRLYSLHGHTVAVIKKGKANTPIEFGRLVSLAMNDDGLILSHSQYQKNATNTKTVGTVLNPVQTNTGERPAVVTADHGFDHSYRKKHDCRPRWGGETAGDPQKGLLKLINPPGTYA